MLITFLKEVDENERSVLKCPSLTPAEPEYNIMLSKWR